MKHEKGPAQGRASMGAPPMATRITKPMAMVMARTLVMRLASLLSPMSSGLPVSVHVACMVWCFDHARHARSRARECFYGAQEIRSDVQSLLPLP